jgi:hypothetical protein
MEEHSKIYPYGLFPFTRVSIKHKTPLKHE